MTKKTCTVIVAALLCVVFALTACQPTPEVAPVVNKREEIPKGAVKEEASGEPADGASYFAPVEYEVTDHWTETLNPADFFTINVDADVLMPKTEKVPVQRIERFDLTQELVDQFIAKLVPEGSKFFDSNIPTTKGYYEDYLLDLKKQKAELIADGFEQDTQWMDEEIANAEKMMAEAPETVEKTYVEPVFTHQFDWEKNQLDTSTPKTNLSVMVEEPDGTSHAGIYATKYDPGISYGPNFGYYGARTEQWKWWEQQEKFFEDPEGLKWIDELEDEEERKRQQEYYDREKKFITDLKAALEKNTMDLDAAQKQAVALLEEMGITGVQITSCEKALYEKTENQLEYEYSTEYIQEIPKGGNAAVIDFVRECGGIPCAANANNYPGEPTDPAEWGASMYSAPFYMETGQITITEEGEIVAFNWDSGAQVVETVAADSELIPFEEAKKRAADQFLYNNTYWLEDMAAEDRANYTPSYRLELDEVKLEMSYINAKDDPDRSLVIPVWRFSGTAFDASKYTEVKDPDSVQEEYEMGRQDVLISALDGGVVLPPGMAQQFKDQQRYEAEAAQEAPAQEVTISA